MTRFTTWKHVVVILAIVLLSTYSLGFGEDDGTKRKRKSVYEYCTLSMVTIGDESRSAFDRKGKPRVLAADMGDLFSKLDISGDGTLLAFMNHLGTKGWRFVEIEHQRSADGNVTLYYFERSRKK